jgi:hypothetical protein
MRSVFTVRTGRYGEFRLVKKKDGERWVCEGWTEYADKAGEIVPAETGKGLCRRPGSGKVTDPAYRAEEAGAMEEVDGSG